MTTNTVRYNVFAGFAYSTGRSRLRSILMGATGLALASTSGIAFAQEGEAPVAAPAATDPASDPATSDDERLRLLGVVTVTARRREERLQDAPVAITALTGDSLGDLAIDDFVDLSTQVPTMIAGRAASGSSASIFLRGVGSTALSAGFDQSVSFNIGSRCSRVRKLCSTARIPPVA